MCRIFGSDVTTSCVDTQTNYQVSHIGEKKDPRWFEVQVLFNEMVVVER